MTVNFVAAFLELTIPSRLAQAVLHVRGIRFESWVVT